MTLSPELQKIIAGLATDIKPLVDDIEASLPTTQEHYDRYMALFTEIQKKHPNDTSIALIAFACIKAGASRNGVGGALIAMGF